MFLHACIHETSRWSNVTSTILKHKTKSLGCVTWWGNQSFIKCIRCIRCLQAGQYHMGIDCRDVTVGFNDIGTL